MSTWKIDKHRSFEVFGSAAMDSIFYLSVEELGQGRGELSTERHDNKEKCVRIVWPICRLVTILPSQRDDLRNDVRA